MRPKGLTQRLNDHPFRPFRIHLSDGTVLPVKDPAMIIVSDTTAIITRKFGRDEDGTRIARQWCTIDLLHIVQFSEIDERRNGRRIRRKG